MLYYANYPGYKIPRKDNSSRTKKEKLENIKYMKSTNQLYSTTVNHLDYNLHKNTLKLSPHQHWRGEQHASEVKEPLTANFANEPGTEIKELHQENHLIYKVLKIQGSLSI